MIGVYTFVYAFAHLLTYIVFEIQLDMALVASEIVSRPYIIVGMAALLLLFALTATSFKRIQRNMGKKWQKLHNSIYLILPLALLHFSWSQKTFLARTGLVLDGGVASNESKNETLVCGVPEEKQKEV